MQRQKMIETEDSAKKPQRTSREGDDEGAMSPAMRALLMSFVEPDAERTWNADAFRRHGARAA